MPHTPGPWEVHHWGDNEGDIHGSDGKVVCVMRDGATPQEEDWEGDARLIAAAPDLLAVCNAIASDLSLLQFTDGEYRLSEQSAGVILQSLRQVIAKAEGRE